MTITPELVDAYKTLLTKPQDHNLPIRPFEQCFEKSDECTAFHKLYQQFMADFKRDLPKILFYIIFEQIYGPVNGKDNGDAGYFIKYIPKL